MLKEDWRKAVDWGLAMGLSASEAIAAADKQAREKKVIDAAEHDRFSVYGMPREQTT